MTLACGPRLPSVLMQIEGALEEVLGLVELPQAASGDAQVAERIRGGRPIVDLEAELQDLLEELEGPLDVAALGRHDRQAAQDRRDTACVAELAIELQPFLMHGQGAIVVDHLKCQGARAIEHFGPRAQTWRDLRPGGERERLQQPSNQRRPSATCPRISQNNQIAPATRNPSSSAVARSSAQASAARTLS